MLSCTKKRQDRQTRFSLGGQAKTLSTAPEIKGSGLAAEEGCRGRLLSLAEESASAEALGLREAGTQDHLKPSQEAMGGGAS